MAESTPTIYDVAERAGVSIATVSRALNSLASVRPATRDRVLRAMDELDFVPNAIARGLSIGKHGILGLVFTRVVGENNLAVEEASLLYTDIVIRGAETRAAEKGYSLLLSSFDETHPSGMSALLSLTGTVDGLIVMDRVLGDEDVAYLARRIPVVLLAGRGDFHRGYHSARGQRASDDQPRASSRRGARRDAGGIRLGSSRESRRLGSCEGISRRHHGARSPFG